MKNVKVGMFVSVPDRVRYPGRRDPYEWENGIVLEVTETSVKVRVYNSFLQKSYEKWFPRSWAVKKVSYSHRVGEEAEFRAWVSEQGVQA